MTTALTKPNGAAAVAERALIQGDLSGLSEAERIAYYTRVCESVGLNPLTQPFEYIRLSGKLKLYAKKDCADQLRKNNNIGIRIVKCEEHEGVYEVTARACTSEGREDEDVGCVTIKGLQGDALANARMKAVTKAKRRVTLSICGLGFLDESEQETVPSEVKAAPVPAKQIEQSENPKATPPQLQAIADLAQRCGFQDRKELNEYLAQHHNIPTGSKLTEHQAQAVILDLQEIVRELQAKQAAKDGIEVLGREPGDDEPND